MTACPVCNIWAPANSLATECTICGAVMDKAERYQCYVPYGFITTLEPKSAKEDFDQILTTASRVSIAEAYTFLPRQSLTLMWRYSFSRRHVCTA